MAKIVWHALRLAMGFVFFWAFIDKLLGLGFATTADKAWINGGSPTFAYLKFASKGPFSQCFQAIAGNGFVDWLFMMGLLLVGLALLLGMGVFVAGYSGALMMILMYASAMPPMNNPIIDQHVIYLILLIGIAHFAQGHMLGKWWSKTKLVKKYPFLK